MPAKWIFQQGRRTSVLKACKPFLCHVFKNAAELHMEISNSVTMITGAASGIGRELAYGFAKAGSSVLMADIREAPLQKAKDELLESGLKVDSCIADVRRFSDAQMIVRECVDRFGKVNVLINNAGIRVETHPDGYSELHRVIPQARVQDMSLSDWDLILETNLKSIFLCSKAAIPEIIKNSEGAIINISSGFGRKGGSGRAAYSASKHGIEGFTKSLALELQESNIGVNCIHPDGRVNVDGRGGHDVGIMVPPALFLAAKCGTISGRSVCANRWAEELKEFLS